MRARSALHFTHGNSTSAPNQRGTEPNGVDKHSSKDGNLMTPTASGNKLNQKQCDKARASTIVKPTSTVCACAPTEAGA